MIVIYDKQNDRSILFVNYQGRLKPLYTPFQVIAITAVGILKANTLVYVEAVAATRDGELLYIIYGEPYYYFYFYLVAKF